MPILCGIGLALAACARRPEQPVTVLRVWCHQGQQEENLAMRRIARAFNAANRGRHLQVDISFFPDFQYTEKLAIAAAAGDLPDAMDVDSPLIARYVQGGILAPLDSSIGAAERADFLPSLIEEGTIHGKLYALGAYESAAVLYYDRDMLRRAGVSPPPGEAGWTWEQFLAACRRLRAAGMEPVAMHMDDPSDEWYTYAFSPMLWSGGGRMISGETQVRGVLASPRNIRSLEAWQTLFREHDAQTDPVDPDPFGDGQTAMDWDGHWMARSHLARKGTRLGAMPLPRLGGAKAAPCGSWAWAIAARTRHPEQAACWVRWVTGIKSGIEPLVRANGAVPGRKSAFADFPEYGRSPYDLFRRELEQDAHPRPKTPYYAALTQHFAAALRDIARGAPVGPRLRTTEDQIQRIIDRKGGDR